MIGWSFPIADFYAAELEGCSAVENLTVNTNLLSSSDVQEQVNLALSTDGDSPYDIMHAANGQVSDWGGKGWLMPLNDLVEHYWGEYDLGDIPEVIWEGGTLDGNIYGVPIIGNTLHLFYRSDVLAEMDMEAPETYADVIAFCDAVGMDNMDWDAPFGMDLSRARGRELEFFMVLGVLGGTYIGEGSQPALNGPEGVQAVELMVDVYNSCLGEAASSLSNNGMETGMHQGVLPMVKLWASRAAGTGYQTTTFARDRLGIPAYGQKIKMRYMDFWRAEERDEERKLVENHVLIDILGVLEQAGYDVNKVLRFVGSKPPEFFEQQDGEAGG